MELLFTMDEVLWQEEEDNDNGGSRPAWKPSLSEQEVATFQQVKNLYNSILLLVHPDKIIDRPPKQKLLARRIWDVLQAAYYEREKPTTTNLLLEM
jgi:hypothetical protein